MKKNEIKQMLMEMRKNENEEAVNYLLCLIDMSSEEELQEKLEKSKICDENIRDILADKIERLQKKEENSEKFINVNKFFCYGRTGDTLHMHLIPKNLRGLKLELGDKGFNQYFKDQLEDFLSRMQDVFKSDSSAKSLFAVSSIFFHPDITSIHEELGFDKITEIDLKNEQDEMGKEQKMRFLRMFRGKKVYYTRMTREKILAADYKRIPEEEKAIKDDDQQQI